MSTVIVSRNPAGATPANMKNPQLTISGTLSSISYMPNPMNEDESARGHAKIYSRNRIDEFKAIIYIDTDIIAANMTKKNP
ncbi:MAG: hypothetical protein ACFFER_12490 [Candidatus Thorarchaeota archaeon]